MECAVCHEETPYHEKVCRHCGNDPVGDENHRQAVQLYWKAIRLRSQTNRWVEPIRLLRKAIALGPRLTEANLTIVQWLDAASREYAQNPQRAKAELEGTAAAQQPEEKPEKGSWMKRIVGD